MHFNLLNCEPFNSVQFNAISRNSVICCTVKKYQILYCSSLWFIANVLCCTTSALYCSNLHCTLLYYYIIYNTIMQYTVLLCNIQYCYELYFTPWNLKSNMHIVKFCGKICMILKKHFDCLMLWNFLSYKSK